MNQVTPLQNQTAIVDMYSQSPAIWGNCPIAWLKKNPDKGQFWRIEAQQFPLIGTQTTQIGTGCPDGMKIFASTDGGIVPVSAINSVERVGGAVKFTGGTNNHSAWLTQAYPSFRLSGLASSMGPLWFEFCVAQNSLLVDTQGWFGGIGETEQFTLATGVPFNGGDAITNGGSMIGFRKGEDALAVVDTVYSDRATAFTNVTGGTTAGGTTDSSALSAAYTFARFGFYCDPRHETDTSRWVRFFQDNNELATAISKATLIATTNLKANALGPMFGIITDSSGTATESYLKWMQIAQVNPGIEW